MPRQDPGFPRALARPGDTILISSGAPYMVSNLCIDKPLCLVGGGSLPEDTVLVCPQEFESALEFSASGRVVNLTIKAELGTCLLHRKGHLTIEGCILCCVEHPLEHLSCPIVSTAGTMPSALTKHPNAVSVIETRIEGGTGAVKTDGSLVLQEVRVVYERASLVFWFNISQEHLAELDVIVACNA
eukprot:c22297_g1_i3 orf=177-734(+)